MQLQMLKEKSGFAVRRFVSSMLFLHVIALILHIAEIFVSASAGKTALNISIFSIAFLNDISFIAKVTILVFPFYILIYWVSDFLARMSMGFALILTILILVGLMQYYLISNMLLGADLWNYSLHDIKLTVKASASLSWWQIIIFPLFIVIAMRFHYWFQHHTLSFTISSGIALAYALITLLNANVQLIELKDVNAKSLVINKGAYFLDKTREFIKGNELNSPYMQQELLASAGAYPLQYKQDIKDELGPFLQKTSNTPPNIVFVVVEGLGKTFIGPSADYIGCMPYLDSLSDHSLFWSNFLSTTGRTFGILPSMLGSLPYGKGGFMEQENYPHHTSLVKLLKQNGYNTGFYYGGDAKFDGQKRFLEHQGIDIIMDENSFTNEYQKIPANSGGFSWGYADKALYKQSMDFIPKKGPFFNIYLTVTTHEPFNLNNPEEFESQYNSFVRSKGNNNQIVTNKNAFKTLMYADDAIRLLINEYQKRPDYNNTIFVITGDHRMIPINHKNEIDRYHVPLIIYSPMLTTNKLFKSIASHADIPSTFTTYLQKNYNLNFPDSVHWLGKGLTFNTSFSSNKHIAIMRNKGQISEYVFGKYFITDGALQDLSDNLIQTQNRDVKQTKKVEDYMNQFKQINDYVCQSDRLYNIDFTAVAPTFGPDTGMVVLQKREKVAVPNTKSEKTVNEPANTTSTQTRTVDKTKTKDVAKKPVQSANNAPITRKSSELETAQAQVRENPTSAQAYYNLGIQHIKENNLPWAKTNLEKAIALNYKFKEPYIALINLELLRNNTEAARSYYYKAIGVFGKVEFASEYQKIKEHRKKTK